MIAQKFRSVVWVVGVAVAATLLYIVSLQVATERGRLEAVDRKIAATKRDIRQLQTEMGTRASLRQLERWNGEVLALSAPGAGQYLSGEDDISNIDRSNLGNASAPPPPVMAAVMVRPDAAAVTDVVVPNSPESAAAKPAKIVQGPAVQLSAQDRQVQQAFSGAKPRDVAPTKIVSMDRSLIGKQALGDIAKAARAEATSGGKARP